MFHPGDDCFLKALMEELICFGVLKIAIRPDRYLYNKITHFPKAYKDRIERIDKYNKVTEQAKALFTPIANEFGFCIAGDFLRPIDPKYHIRSPFSSSDSDEAVSFMYPSSSGTVLPLMQLYANLPPFLLGLKYRLQVYLDLEATTKAINFLYGLAEKSESRIILANLKSIFDTYRPQEVDAPVFISGASNESVFFLQELVRDEEYKQLSLKASLFGYPSLWAKSIGRFGRKAKRLITKYRGRLDLGSNIISGAASLPILSDPLFSGSGKLFAEALNIHKALIKTDYFPPIVSLEKTIKNVETAVASRHPHSTIGRYGIALRTADSKQIFIEPF
jgi:hypothetical protein